MQNVVYRWKIWTDADQSDVVCKLQELDRGLFSCAVRVQGEEQWGENTALRSSSTDRTVLDENFPSLTTCCLSVGKLVIHWQTEVGMESCVSLFWTVSGMIVKSWAEVYKQDPHIRPWSVQMLQDEVQSLALKVNCRGSSGVLQISQNQSFKWLHDHRR